MGEWGECRFLGSEHLSFADSADLAYVIGHGNSLPSIEMSKGQNCNLKGCGWGSFSSPDRKGDLEYIVFQSCSVLKMDSDWRKRWRHYEDTKNQKRPFSGLHIAMGFKTLYFASGRPGERLADEFGENLKDGDSVRYAWYEAVDDFRWMAGYKGNRPAIFYIRPHKDETIMNGDELSSDYLSKDFKYGDWSYKLDAYYMEDSSEQQDTE